MSLHDVEWRRLGACRGLDASIFYPEDDEDAAVAKSVCAGCGVRVACLEHALSSREKAGVWGGATERERRRIIRQTAALGVVLGSAPPSPVAPAWLIPTADAPDLLADHGGWPGLLTSCSTGAT